MDVCLAKKGSVFIMVSVFQYVRWDFIRSTGFVWYAKSVVSSVQQIDVNCAEKDFTSHQSSSIQNA
jgi:hypothetical protein